MTYRRQLVHQARLFGGAAPWDEVLAAAARLPAPTGPAAMFDLARQAHLCPGQVVLDVGAYGSRHAMALAGEFGCSVIALDLVFPGLAGAADGIRAAGLESLVFRLQADAHELPIRSGCIDLIWSRDMLSCVEPPRFLAECARVLTAGGFLILHAVYFTGLLEPKERARLAAALSLTGGCERDGVEAAIADAGLDVVRALDLGAEWRESELLEGSSRLADDHLTVMRLRRGASQLVSEFGQAWYETILASHEWAVLMALGKLTAVLYLLRRS
jgi:SAM-dependent methyltransferase